MIAKAISTVAICAAAVGIGYITKDGCLPGLLIVIGLSIIWQVPIIKIGESKDD